MSDHDKWQSHMNRKCSNCGERYGQHSGEDCPGKHKGKTTFKESKAKADEPRVWELTEPDEVLLLANKIHEAMVVREKIPDRAKPTMRLTLEVIYEQE